MEENGISMLGAVTNATFSRTLESWFGPGVHRPVIGSFTWSDLASSLGVIGLLLLLHLFAVTWFSRRRKQTTESGAENAGMTRDAIAAVSQPLYLLIWVIGVYLAGLPLVAQFASEEGSNLVPSIWRKCLDAGVGIVLFWLFWRFTRLLEKRLSVWTARSDTKLDDLFVPLLGRTLRVVVPVVAVILVLPVIGIPPAYSQVIGKLSSLLIIGIVSWILFQVVGATEKMVLSRYDISVADNLQARKVYTQVHVISKTLYVLISIFAVASALMLFEEVRRFGTSILASAGVIGIIVGFAAQKTIANLFAGFQLAMTQPIRLDDVVIVENEWGRVEEITLTYVVIKIWDDRRLVVPLSYFIEKAFQNWTRVSSQLLGSVFIWTDYSVPMTELRKVVQDIVEHSPDWDRRFWNLQVTDTSERAVQLRVLATSADSGKGWNLRCEIREKLIGYIQKNHPESLPRFRAEVDSVKSAAPQSRILPHEPA